MAGGAERAFFDIAGRLRSRGKSCAVCMLKRNICGRKGGRMIRRVRIALVVYLVRGVYEEWKRGVMDDMECTRGAFATSS